MQENINVLIIKQSIIYIYICILKQYFMYYITSTYSRFIIIITYIFYININEYNSPYIGDKAYYISIFQMWRLLKDNI